MKRYLAMLCALITLAVLPSCDDNQQDISESSDGVSESTTEEVTEPETTASKETTTTAAATTAKATETTTAAKVKNKKYTFGDLSFELPEDCEEDINSGHALYTFSDSSLFQIVEEDCSDFDLYHSEDSLKQLSLEAFISAMMSSGTFEQSGESKAVNINGELALKQEASVYGNFDATIYAFVYEDSFYCLCFSSMIGTGAYDAQDKIIKSISFDNDSKPAANKNEATTPEAPSVPTEYLNALKKANSYANNQYMSKSRLYNQLISEYGEHFSEDAANYAIENVVTDYNQNALMKADSYANNQYMSKSRLYNQLISEYGEGFTESEAQYAVDNVETDYNYNALQKAISYQENLSMSKERIYEQLISEYGEGFTPEEAQYAIDNLG